MASDHVGLSAGQAAAGRWKLPNVHHLLAHGLLDSSMTRACRSAAPFALAALLLSTGCEREGVRAYSVARQRGGPATGSAGGSVGGASTTPTTAGKVIWTVPAGWRAVQSEQAMRLATFRAGSGEGVEVTVAAFPGDVGGLLANVNRWRGQLGLEAAVEADLPSMIKTSRGESGEVQMLRLVGPKGQDMLGAIMHPGDGQTWFLKATAAPAALDGIAESFTAFAGTFRLEQGAAASAEPAPSGTPLATPGDMMNAPVPPGSVPTAHESVVGPRLAGFTPPANWTAESGGSGIVAAAFNATNGDGGARITATSLFNEGGGTLANINRWRDQMGLGPVGSLDQQPKTDLGKGALVVDLADPAGARRMVAAVVPDASSGQTWFFKLTGGVKGVEAERAAFDRFVRSVGLGEP